MPCLQAYHPKQKRNKLQVLSFVTPWLWLPAAWCSQTHTSTLLTDRNALRRQSRNHT